MNGTEDCVGDLLQVQQQQEPQYPMIEVEKIETISNVEQQQDVQQVQQHSEQIKQMYDKVYMEVAEVDRNHTARDVTHGTTKVISTQCSHRDRQR